MTTDKLSADVKVFLERTSTETFLFAARHFVRLLETQNISNQVFYTEVHTALLDLYAAGHKLDHIELKYSSADISFDRDAIFENKNVGQISELGEDAFYWEIFDPAYSEKQGQPNPGWTVTDREATQGWLVDDFADIYHDLKIELIKIDDIGTDEAVEDALWQLKWGFSHHWGQHCINALRYFHYLRYDGKQAI
ncbi:MAG TPA: DUF5063 domain-containing protein [Verrucomicrobiae bacterium]|nr:DUF5063 domain-containing protein [Verrucomicrobiae bacterium]